MRLKRPVKGPLQLDAAVVVEARRDWLFLGCARKVACGCMFLDVTA